VPVIFGEYGEHYNGSCNSANTQAMITWADQNNVNYEAWTWDTWGGCSTLSLISDFNGATNPGAYATWIHDHYLGLPGPG
jgi:hypothetical protein